MTYKVLMTGASGFIGRHILNELTKKSGNLPALEVHCLTRQPPSKLNDIELLEKKNKVFWHQVEFLHTDPIDYLEKIRPTHLLHLAWTTAHGAFWQDDSNWQWLDKSTLLLSRFQEFGGSRFVFAGTCAEYAWQDGPYIEGQSSENPETIYGQAKLSMTQALEQSPLSTATGRIFHTFGPGEGPLRLVPTVARALISNTAAKCSDGKQIRDFLYVQDLASAFTNLLFSNLEGVVNVASGQPTTIRDFLVSIAKELNAERLLIFDALPRAKNDPNQIYASTKRLNEELDWRPSTSIEHAIRETISRLI